MNDYRVELDIYHGPLDLLLHLIKRDEIDIHDIPIRHITEQYLRYVETLKRLDVELAGEFLVMAATLMEIKSAMMAMREAAADADGDEAATEAMLGEATGDEATDPRFELVQQLLAYKRFKDMARALDDRRSEYAGRFPRRAAKFEQEQDANAPVPLDLDDVSVWDLLETFSRLIEQVGGPPRVEFVHDDTPIELHAADIVDRLQRDGAMTLQAMFEGRPVQQMIGLFLALLELMRQQKVRAKQGESALAINLELRPEAEWLDLAHDMNDDHEPWPDDPGAPDNFDWPDESTRQRYARRIERRSRGEVILEDTEFEEDVNAIADDTEAPASDGDR